MGGGNGQKAKMAREKNLEKQKAAKGSQLESNKKAMTIQNLTLESMNEFFTRTIPAKGMIFQPLGILFFFLQCKVCMQTFICTTSEVKCKEHAEAKHPKSELNACFPHLKK